MDKTNTSEQPAIAARERIVWVWPLAILLVIVVVLGGMFAARELSDDQKTQSAENRVVINADGVLPATITVKKGQAVSWSNQDKKPHLIKGEQEAVSSLDSDEWLDQDESYAYTFETKGTYTYHDAANPEAIRGTVIVE